MKRVALRTLIAALVGTVTLVVCANSKPTSAQPNDPSGTGSAIGTRSIASTTAGLGREPARSADRVLQVGGNARVSVSVATLWRSPNAPRAVDAPALAHPARIKQWLADMTVAQRKALSGRADTQVLFGDRVRILRLRPQWAKIVVPSQPSPLDDRGYPGWVPRRQITVASPHPSRRWATVVARTTWLRTDDSEGAGLFKISFGTRLPVVGLTPRFVRVSTPVGTVRRLGRGAVVLHAAGEPALMLSRRSLVRTATSFVGLPYLWAGVSGFGLDCSGLTWLDFRVHGMTIPRDASPQSKHGSSVKVVRRGDLMFYATNGLVHHVSMYVGDGLMVHSPRTGRRVQVIATTTPPYPDEYAGARRYLH
jgi:gamma-D-glutamyl-L-lysine dipeptidyl-peptidase